MRALLPIWLLDGVQIHLARSLRSLAARLTPAAAQPATAEEMTALRARFPNAPMHWLETVARHAPSWGRKDDTRELVTMPPAGSGPAPVFAGRPTRARDPRIGAGPSFRSSSVGVPSRELNFLETPSSPRPRSRLVFASSAPSLQNSPTFKPVLNRGSNYNPPLFPTPLPSRSAEPSRSASQPAQRDTPPVASVPRTGRPVFADAFATAALSVRPRFDVKADGYGGVLPNLPSRRSEPSGTPIPAVSAPACGCAQPASDRPDPAENATSPTAPPANTRARFGTRREDSIDEVELTSGYKVSPHVLQRVEKHNSALLDALTAHLPFEGAAPATASPTPFLPPLRDRASLLDATARVLAEPRWKEPFSNFKQARSQASYAHGQSAPDSRHDPHWPEANAFSSAVAPTFAATTDVSAWPSLLEDRDYEVADREAEAARLNALSAAQEAL